MHWRVAQGWIAIAITGQLVLSAFAVDAAVIPVEGGCTLVDAILAANADAAVGACPAGSGSDEIVLTDNVTLTMPFGLAFSGATGLPVITSAIQIQGGGFMITRSMVAADFRFFAVAGSGELVLRDLLLVGGSLSVLPGNGGAIYNQGDTTLIDSLVSLNDSAGSGGGIFNQGDLHLLSSELVGNTAAENGGGVSNASGGMFTASGSSLSANGAGQLGGGVQTSASGTTELFETEIAGNSATDGGGVFNSGDTSIWSSLLYDNEATDEGGGAKTDGGTLEVLNSTFSANVASQAGGMLSDGATEIVLSTFSGNQADPLEPMAVSSIYAGLGSVEIESIIVAGGGVGLPPCTASGITATGTNFGCHGDPVSGLDLMLQDNGGRTWTHALSASSNARSAASPCPPADRDQRGADRLDTCSSGAYEYGLCEDDVLRDRDVTTSEPLTVCENFWLGPNVAVVGPAGDLSVTVGYQAIFRDGFRVQQDGALSVLIDPDLLP